MFPDSFEFMFQITDDLIRIPDNLYISSILFKFTLTLHFFLAYNLFFVLNTQFWV